MKKNDARHCDRSEAISLLKNGIASSLTLLAMTMFSLFLTFAPVFAQQVEEAESVPSGISNVDYQFLVQQKKHLDETRGLLVKDIDVFNSDCGKVSSSDSAKIEDCTRRQELILARVDTYNRDLVRYQESIQRAREKAPKIVGFEKGDKNSAPEPQPLALSGEEKAELKDTPGDIQTQLSVAQDKIFVKAKAQAAWNLAFFLIDQGKNDEALQYFKEARAGFDDGSFEASMLDRGIQEVKQIVPSPQIPVYKSRADALLDALQYGNRDWDKSYTYLQVAHKANPNDLAVRDALNYFEALYAGENGKSKGVSLGQIKPRKV